MEAKDVWKFSWNAPNLKKISLLKILRRLSLAGEFTIGVSDRKIDKFPETNGKRNPENWPKRPKKERIIFQPLIFRVELF